MMPISNSEEDNIINEYFFFLCIVSDLMVEQIDVDYTEGLRMFDCLLRN
jgi:hypothetical protein